MRYLKYTKIALLAVTLLATVGCEEDKENEGNHLPTVTIQNSTQTVNQGDTVNLLATAEDVDGDELSYQWSIQSRPTGSEATLSSSTNKETSFVADKAGKYQLTFHANDGLSDSTIKTATITSKQVVAPSDETQTGETGVKVVPLNPAIDGTGVEGFWVMDQEKTGQHIKENTKNEFEEMVLGLVALSLLEVEIEEGGSCKILGKNKAQCWENDGDTYKFSEDENGTIEIKLIGVNTLRLIMKSNKENENDMIFAEYSRKALSTLTPPSIVMEKERVYRATGVKSDWFGDNKEGYGYLIFNGELHYNNLLTEALSSLTLERFNELIEKSKNSDGFLLDKGGYEMHDGDYRVKDNAFYTVTGLDDPERKIEIVTPEHIKFDGYDYYLE